MKTSGRGSLTLRDAVGKLLLSSLPSPWSGGGGAVPQVPWGSHLTPFRPMQVCPFSLRVVSVVGITYLLPQEEQPLCHPTVER